jgi:uncharacterized Fe-S radical SAM superfamily protein PflX
MRQGSVDARVFEPAYVRLLASGELDERARIASRHLESCDLCARSCRANRKESTRGAVCRTGERARVDGAFPHFGEEACLTGWAGSGTIFFSWCNLRCVYCQNWHLSWGGAGREVGPEELAGMMLALERAGCHNQVGDLAVDPDGIARRGLLVRHLVLPGGVSGTDDVLRFIAEEISPATYVNLMSQYRPCFRAFEHEALARRPTAAELREARDAARRLGLRRLDPGSAC